MKLKKEFVCTVVGISVLAFLAFIPVLTIADATTAMPNNPYPDKIYGDEFRSEASPYGIGWGFGYTDNANENRSTRWQIEFFLTPSQMNQLTQWEKDNPTMPMIDAFTELVPEQVNALPDVLRNYLLERRDIQLNPKGDLAWSHDAINNIWTDPSGTEVPQSDVPRNIYPGDILGVSLTEGSQYTKELKTHLENLGFLTDASGLDPVITTSIQKEGYVINFQGNTQSGQRKSWTFILNDTGIWHNTDTGQSMDGDMQYVLAAFGYVNPPGQSYSFGDSIIPVTNSATIKVAGITSQIVLHKASPGSSPYQILPLSQILSESGTKNHTGSMTLINSASMKTQSPSTDPIMLPKIIQPVLVSEPQFNIQDKGSFNQLIINLPKSTTKNIPLV